MIETPSTACCTHIAIDPGASGGIAARLSDGAILAWHMPDSRRDLIDLLRALLGSARPPSNPDAVPKILIEKITGFIPFAGPGQMFSFGEVVERPACILETLGVRFTYVAPKSWQKTLGLGREPVRGAQPRAKSSLRQRTWKNKLRAEAQRRFPSVNVTLKTADALLILDVCRGAHADDWML